MECPNCKTTDYSKWTVIYEGTYGFRPQSVDASRVATDFHSFCYCTGHPRELNCGNCGHRWLPPGVMIDPV